MKKLILVVSIIFFTMSSFNTSEKIETKQNDPDPINDPCVNIAWDLADKWCARRAGGCSEYQEWYFTNIAYNECNQDNEIQQG